MRHKQLFTNMIFIITVITMSIYLLWRIFFTIPFQEGTFSLIMGVLLLYAEIVSSLGTLELFWRRTSVFELEFPDIPDSWYPDVDIFIATHNEPVELLYNTANACTFMEYPDRDKVHIYLCDDGFRKEIADLAKKLGVHYIGLKNNKHAKSGNLNNALSNTYSPLVVTFDADMLPRSNFLLKTIPYFFLPKLKKTEDGKWIEREEYEIDEQFKIGFIQTPQSFYNPDLFQYNLYSEKNIPNEQDFFTKEVNVLRNKSNAVAYTGSNTVIARQALQDIGGFPTDTITEDFETGIKIQSLGYTTYATTEVLASGLTPTTFKSMISQRKRWARGVIQSTRNCKIPFNKGLSVAARISYMVSYSYWWSFARRIIFTLSPILFALFGIRIADCGFWDLLIFWGPSHFFYSISMRSLSKDTRNQRWCQIIDTILAPYLILPVILENLGIKQKKFKVTRKNKDERNSKNNSILYAIPHLILLGLSIAALIKFTSGKYGMALIYGSIIIFWLVYNIINLVYAVFFMWGRKIYRETERFDAIEPLMICYDQRTLNTKTVNLSEGGIAFELNRPEYIPDDKPITFIIYNERYRAEFEGNIIYVKPLGNVWIYGVKINSLTEESRRQFTQIVYDRMHSLPTKLNTWVTAIDDLSNNFSSRLDKQWMDKRKLPRITLNRKVVFEDGSTGVLVNFNYRYMMITEFKAVKGENYHYNLKLTDSLSIKLELMDNLFRVVNWEELVYNNNFTKFIDDWARTKNEE